MGTTGTNKLLSLSPWVLIIAAVLTYGSALDNSFIFDDVSSIVENRDIRTLWPPAWAQPVAEGKQPVNARPLVSLSLALNYAIGGLDPSGYRVCNLLLHILCALTAFAVFKRILAPRGSEVAAGLALASTLIWLLHPLNNQCINYIVQRSELLMGLFYLLMIYCIGSVGRRWQLSAVLFASLGMASKEVMVTAPVVGLVYDAVFVSGSVVSALKKRPWMYVGIAASWGLLAAILSTNPHGATIGYSTSTGAWDYALNQCWVLVEYLQKSFWPHPLVLDYGSVRPLTLYGVLPQALIVVGLLCTAAFIFFFRSRVLGFAGCWFFFILAPTSSIVPIVAEVGAERRMYLPLLALVGLVVIGFYTLLQKVVGNTVRAQRICWGLVACCSLVLGVVTHQRNGDFVSPKAAWQSAVAAMPDNDRAHYNLALELHRIGELDAAIVHYARGIDLGEEKPGEYFGMGSVLHDLERWDAAAHYYANALNLDPNYCDAHNNMGVVLKVSGQLERAAEHFRQAAELEPTDVDVLSNLSYTLLELGEFEDVVVFYQRAVSLSPADAQLWNDLGTALARRGSFAEALTAFERALEQDPALAVAQRNRDLARAALSP
jgi:protein O-mannosyl-transferase